MGVFGSIKILSAHLQSKPSMTAYYKKITKSLNLWLSRLSTAMGLNTRFSMVGPTIVKACKSLAFTQ